MVEHCGPLALYDSREQRPPLEAITAGVRWRQQYLGPHPDWVKDHPNDIKLGCGDISFENYENDIRGELKWSIGDGWGMFVGDRFPAMLDRMTYFPHRTLILAFSYADVLAGHRWREPKTGKTIESKVSPARAVSLLTHWHVRYGVAPIFCGTPQAAGEFALVWLAKAATEVERTRIRD